MINIALLHIIRADAENEHYLRVLEFLGAAPHQTAAKQEFADLLTLLIEDFEERHDALKPASPTEHIMELMAAHDLKQKDPVDIFGTLLSFASFMEITRRRLPHPYPLPRWGNGNDPRGDREIIS